MPSTRPFRILCLAGLPGTGKSALAAELGRRLDAPVLDKDRVRLALFGAAWTDYVRAQDDVCFDAMLAATRYLAAAGRARDVVLDGRTFARRADAERVRAFAAELGAELVLVRCTCPDEVALARLEADRGHHPARDRTPALYRRLAAAAEPLPAPVHELDTSGAPPSALAEALLAELEAASTDRADRSGLPPPA